MPIPEKAKINARREIRGISEEQANDMLELLNAFMPMRRHAPPPEEAVEAGRHEDKPREGADQIPMTRASDASSGAPTAVAPARP